MKETNMAAEEVQLVLSTIVHGKPLIDRKATYQAHAAAVSDISHVRIVMTELMKDIRFASSRSKVFAFRILPKDYEQQVTNGVHPDNIKVEEAFEEDKEIGAGEKLLYLLQRLGVDNILLVVTKSEVLGGFCPSGPSSYKNILERAKVLINELHDLAESHRREDEARQKKLEEDRQKAIQLMQLVPYDPDMNRFNKQSKERATAAVPTKHMNADAMVPPSARKVGSRKPLRPAHFKTQMVSAQSGPNSTMVEAQLALCNSEPIQVQDDTALLRTVGRTETALENLTKADIAELKSMIRPHPFVEKIMESVCTLRGCPDKSWKTAKELLSSATFRFELIIFDIGTLSDTVVDSVKTSLKQSQLTLEEVRRISQCAATLLQWVIAILHSYDERRNTQTAHMIEPAQTVANNLGSQNNDLGLQQTHNGPVTVVPNREVVLPTTRHVAGNETVKNITRLLQRQTMKTQYKKVLASEQEAPNIFLPATDDELVQYLERAALDDQSTDTLLELAERLRDRRLRVYEK
eukprot:GILJ01006223.1.p1 GENE.GILJ01006223.1~~GILJ01006223.1.p1  ORF type:complete len:532 (+),score=101.13 GILJ01006223.1:34-1596(+)